MLGVGLDWAEDHHDVALGLPGKGVIEQFRIEHGPHRVARLVVRCLALEADPAEVRVVLETRHGLLVEALLDAGFAVLLANPDLVTRRRGPARKKKDDAEDARICCLLAPDQCAELRKLIPHGDLGAELRAIAGDDDRAARDERRIGSRLPVRPELARAKACTIRLTAAQLLLLRTQRRAWQRRIGELLLGSPRYGRAKQPKDPQPGNAFCGLHRSTWARAFYDAKIAAGKSHHAALRALGNRWLEILWHCLRLGVTYDATIHNTNQQRHLAPAA